MKKNIWIMNHYATSMFRDKGGRHYWFAENLLKKGFKPTIFCANTFHNSIETITIENSKFTVKKTDNIPFVFVKTTTAIGNGIDRVKNMSLFAWNLISVAKQYAKMKGKPDIILASSVHPLTLLAGIRIAKYFGVPCICEVRDLWPETIFFFDKAREKSLLGKLLVEGEYWIYRNADALIFTKEGDTDYIKEKKWDISQGGKIDLERTHYINNGVNLESFDRSVFENIVDDKDLSNDNFNVVYVGAIRPINNIGNILNVAKLLEADSTIQFLIYGDGNEKNKLEQRVKKESISNVQFKGYVNKKYIPYVLSKSAVNLLNYSATQYNWSRGNSSNKLFEYMASGKPIISTVKMGYSIIEKYNCGIELESTEPEVYAEAILKLKNMPYETYSKIGENGKKGAEDFDFEILTNKLIDVIHSVK